MVDHNNRHIFSLNLGKSNDDLIIRRRGQIKRKQSTKKQQDPVQEVMR